MVAPNRLTVREALQLHQPDGLKWQPTDDPEKAICLASDGLQDFDDQKIADTLLPVLSDRFWYLGNRYIGKRPSQQWAIRAGGMSIDMYNYEPRLIQRKKVAEIAGAMALFGAHFPTTPANAPKTLAVTADLPRANYKDPTKGMASPNKKLIELTTLGAIFSNRQFRPHLQHVSALEGSVLHELGHFELDELLSPAWQAAGFSWSSVLTPTGKHQRKNGDYLYTADQPQACVSDYARISEAEDICDSAVVYLKQFREMLNAKKLVILQSYDQRRDVKKPKIEERTPEIPKLPRTLYFMESAA